MFSIAARRTFTRRPLFSSALKSFSSFSTSTTEGQANENAVQKDTPTGWRRFFTPEGSQADESYKNRWFMALPAFLTHICIGSPWAWSVMSSTVSRELGFVASSSGDWSMMQTTIPLSIIFFMQGVGATIGGKWQAKVGPRAAIAVAGGCFGLGMMLGAAGIAMHSLPLLYLGYGLLGGTGVGLSYTPPIQALIQWFPDRRGLAAGMTSAGFGSGALLFTPMVNKLMDKFKKLPEYLGPQGEVNVENRDGKSVASVGGQFKEVVLATKADIARLPYELQEGWYVVGSGSTGAAPALAAMGLTYLGIMGWAAYNIRTPYPGYTVETSAAENENKNKYVAPVPKGNVDMDTVMKTPQFYLLGTVFFCLASGGMGLFSVAKPMMADVFSSALPSIVTASFASSYILMMSSGNLGGRIGWAALSDKIGRRRVFQLFTFGSIPLYLSLPFFVDSVISTGSALPLAAFIASTTLAISAMGGTYALLPAYESDLFGSKYVGGIHGRVLLASSASALAGPSALIWMRGQSEKNAIKDLISKVDPTDFQSTFGADPSQYEQLLEARSLTIPRLMDLVPEGIPDPTPHIYDTTMYTLSGLMAVAAVAHSLVKPVNPKYFEKK